MCCLCPGGAYAPAKTVVSNMPYSNLAATDLLKVLVHKINDLFIYINGETINNEHHFLQESSRIINADPIKV